MHGLRSASENLARDGCRTAYINGSFVTDKELPNDLDASWKEDGVAPGLLDPDLLIFDLGRKAQKAKFFGELFAASLISAEDGLSFLEFPKRTGIRENAGASLHSTWENSNDQERALVSDHKSSGVAIPAAACEHPAQN